MKLDVQQILTLLRNEASRLSTACCLAEYGFAGHRSAIDSSTARIVELTAMLAHLDSGDGSTASASTEPVPETPS